MNRHRPKNSKHKNKRPYERRRLRLESLEERSMLAGVLQGYAFFDSAPLNGVFDPGETPKVGQTIELWTGDGSMMVASTMTNASGYYSFSGLALGDYILVEGSPILGGATATSAAAMSNYYPASSTMFMGKPAIDVEIIDSDIFADRPFRGRLRATGDRPLLAGTPVTFFVGQNLFEVVDTASDFYTFCVNIDEPFTYATSTGPGPTYPITPLTAPPPDAPPPKPLFNWERVAYLYNRYGSDAIPMSVPLNTNLAEALQLAIWELLYDSTQTLATIPNWHTTGDFTYPNLPTLANQGAAVYSLVEGLLTESISKTDAALFLDYSGPLNGGQSVIASGKFNFANAVLPGNPTPLRFDFNFNPSPTQAPTNPPTAGGYVGVLSTDTYTPMRGYGWNTAVGQFDRGDLPGGSVLSQEELRRDGHWGVAGQPRNFQVDLASGTYQVNVTVGDIFQRDNVRFRNLDNASVLGTVGAPANQWAHQSFEVTVTDGSLNLEIADMGGDPYWVINGLEIIPIQTVAGISISPAFAGPKTADGMSTDVFNIVAPAGAMYTVSATKGTLTSPADTTTAAPYVGLQLIGTGAVQTVSILRPTSSGISTIRAEAVTGDALGFTTQTYVVPTTKRFDFNSGSNVTEAGFLGVRGSTLYSSTLGFGWTTAVGEFDRVAAPGSVALKRDGHWGSTGGPRTFSVQTAIGGTYEFRAYVGDNSYARDNIRFTPEGGSAVTAPATAAGSFTTVLFGGTDMNADGKIDVTVSDLGGDPYWVVNGLDVARDFTVGLGNDLPAAAPLQIAGGEVGNTPGNNLTEDVLAPLVDEAIARWLAAGITAEQAASLAAATIVVTDLDDRGYLGYAGEARIEIDDNAVGHGWYIDAAAADDAEFSIQIASPELQAAAGSEAAQGVDLLTVLMHEFGHILGLEDLDDVVSPNSLMTENLGTGVRRLPSPASIAAVDAAVQSASPSEAGLFIDLDAMLGALDAPLTPISRLDHELALVSPTRRSSSSLDPSTQPVGNQMLTSTDQSARGIEERPADKAAEEAEQLDAYFSLLGEAL